MTTRPRIVEALLDRGADLLARAEDGSTALHLAHRENPEPTIAEVLLEWGADRTALNIFGDPATPGPPPGGRSR
jgi:ankyrin repeat protein